jgi:hypothetical protein
MTTPDPDLTTQLADVIAAAADSHGTFDHVGQAEDVLNWLHATNRLTTDPTVTHTATGHLTVNWPEDEITTQLNELNTLRLLLGHEPGDQTCLGEPRSGTLSGPCLLPARHVNEGRCHQGLGGTWPL